MLPLLALDLVAAGSSSRHSSGLVLAVIVGGLLLGVLNTVFTESVMEGTGLPRSVASSSYSAVRFLGAAAAPPLATVLAELFTPGACLLRRRGLRSRSNGDRHPRREAVGPAGRCSRDARHPGHGQRASLTRASGAVGARR